ncbi:MAG: hypothetical protein M1434_09265 [Chloroflexi bacterium]|nr:hypothetical protein [Chloroflexota bacterium]MCL5274913.1 hypothetical protein [Chloroflexota bacterium]
MAEPNPAEERLHIALDALANIEAIARSNSEYFQRVALIAHTALENVQAHREAHQMAEELEVLLRDNEGLGVRP